jgi:biotin synthase
MMPASHVRLSAGREQMSDETQAMTFFAGANSIFYGECLLTTPNPETHRDLQLFRKLGINPEQRISEADDTQEAVILNDLQKQTDSQHFYEA